MVRVNTLILFYTIIIYCIKIVSSIVLDLDNLDNSIIEIVKTTEEGIITTKIYSIPENKITELREGFIIVWMQDDCEYIKSITHYEFLSTKRKLMSIELYSPFEDNMIYLYKLGKHYAYTTRNKFEEIFKKNLEISEKKTRKRKPKSYTDYKRRKSKKKRITKPEDLEPEMEFEISSDESTQQTEKKSEEHTEPEMDFEISSEESKPIESETTKQPEHTSETTKQTEQTETTDERELQPETIPVEVESDDEHEDIDLEQELLNEPLFGEDVEKLLERELDRTGLSTNELDSVFEEKSKDDDN
ncbi:Tash1-like protein, putative [Theileria annulata]|uniref:Tash1-like protein, putative n=1 Tax=Theileria annulata TaxID=5874 RepID=Q4UHE4_THEAN|nr:Tash1-like protein, putative [Theileria annulata]CAI73495.1 Tash1-like protein, putative [Theileria annulata]|eukprot:XP_954172.1 Tash1-like protein, putative [Theileria annulata]